MGSDSLKGNRNLLSYGKPRQRKKQELYAAFCAAFLGFALGRLLPSPPPLYFISPFSLRCLCSLHYHIGYSCAISLILLHRIFISASLSLLPPRFELLILRVYFEVYVKVEYGRICYAYSVRGALVSRLLLDGP